MKRIVLNQRQADELAIPLMRLKQLCNILEIPLVDVRVNVDIGYTLIGGVAISNYQLSEDNIGREE